MKNKCLFCEKDYSIVKRSKEHILRQKNRGLFGLKDTKTRYIRGSRRDQNTKVEYRVFPSSPFEQTVGGVCNVCNNGWMNGIDANFEKLQYRLVKNLPVFAGMHEIHQFKLWAYKTALIRTLLDRDGEVEPPYKHFQNLFKNREPNDDVGIWLFNSHNPKDTHTRHTWGRIYDNEYHQVTISIGSMGAYVIINDSKKFPGFQNEFRRELFEITNGKSIEIWPQGKSFVWPTSMEELSIAAAAEISTTMERILRTSDDFVRMMSFESYKNK